MDPDTFEQLVSQWLDSPERHDLRAQIEAAAAKSEELVRLKNEWLRLDALVRSAAPSVEGLDWNRLHQSIQSGLDTPEAAGFDERLRSLTAVHQRVDWPRLRRRMSQAVASASQRPMVERSPLARASAGVALVAAAAALVFMLTLPARPPAATAGFAQVRVSPPARAALSSDYHAPFARVSVSASPAGDAASDEAQLAQATSTEPQLVEVFLIVGPARPQGEIWGRLIPFDFH